MHLSKYLHATIKFALMVIEKANMEEFVFSIYIWWFEYMNSIDRIVLDVLLYFTHTDNASFADVS